MPEGGAASVFGLPPIIHGPLFTCFLWLLALALGRRLVLWLRLSSSSLSAGELALVMLTLGAGSLQLLPYALGAAHVMNAATVRIAVLVLAALLVPDAFRALVALKQALFSGSKPALSAAFKVWCGLFVCLLAVLLVHASVFGDFGDDDGYHLSAPMRWLRDGTLSYLPSYTHTNASFGFEMLYVIALSFKEGVATKLLHFGAGLWTLLAIALCCRRLGAGRAGIAAISFLMIATPVTNLPQIFPLAFVDFAASWTAMVSVLIWLAWREKHDPALLTCLALCAGLTGSFKFTALAIVVAWACTVTFELRLQRQSWPSILAQVLRFGLIASLPVLPWLFRNWQMTGNPVYPMFPGLIPTRDWTVEHGQLFSRYVRYYSWGVGSGSRLSEGARKALLLGAGASIVGFSAALWWTTQRAALRILIAFAALYTLLCIALTGLLFRYWMPGIACFSIVVFVVLEARWPKANQKYALGLGLMLIALGVQLKTELKSLQELGAELRLATGLSTPAEVQRPRDDSWRMWEKIRAITPADARILVGAFYTTSGASSFGCFPFDRECFVTDSHLQHYIRLDDWSNFLGSVEHAKIQYLLLSDKRWTAGRHGFSFLAGANEYPFCRRLADELSDKVASSGDLSLYRIRSTP